MKEETEGENMRYHTILEDDVGIDRILQFVIIYSTIKQ